MESKKNLTRRDFLRLAAVATTGTLVAACAAPAPTAAPTAKPAAAPTTRRGSDGGSCGHEST